MIKKHTHFFRHLLCFFSLLLFLMFLLFTFSLFGYLNKNYDSAEKKLHNHIAILHRKEEKKTARKMKASTRVAKWLATLTLSECFWEKEEEEEKKIIWRNILFEFFNLIYMHSRSFRSRLWSLWSQWRRLTHFCWALFYNSCSTYFPLRFGLISLVERRFAWFA